MQVPAALRSASAITAVTYSLPVIDEIGSWESPHLVCVGGLYLPDYRAFAGPQAIAGLRELTADVIFLGCDGLTVESGLTTPHVLVAEIGAVATGRARRVIAVADSSKLGRQGFLPIVPLAEVDVLVTDDAADPGARRRDPRGRRGGDPGVTGPTVRQAHWAGLEARDARERGAARHGGPVARRARRGAGRPRQPGATSCGGTRG